MIVQLPSKCYLLWALDSDCCHSSFEAVHDRSLRKATVSLHALPSEGSCREICVAKSWPCACRHILYLLRIQLPEL